MFCDHRNITKKDLAKERRSYTAICESGYYNKVTRICGDKHVVKRFYHSFEKAHNFILEGSNIVLLRYLALQRHKGTVQTDTVMMDGTVCRSIYVSFIIKYLALSLALIFIINMIFRIAGVCLDT